jgi:hypothetical protein
MSSDVKTTFIHPDEEVYEVLAPTDCPDKLEILCSSVQLAEEQRYIVTKSYPDSVLNSVKRRLISVVAEINHSQCDLLS